VRGRKAGNEGGREEGKKGGVGKIFYYNHHTRTLDRYVQSRSIKQGIQNHFRAWICIPQKLGQFSRLRRIPLNVRAISAQII